MTLLLQLSLLLMNLLLMMLQLPIVACHFLVGFSWSTTTMTNKSHNMYQHAQTDVCTDARTYTLPTYTGSSMTKKVYSLFVIFWLSFWTKVRTNKKDIIAYSLVQIVYYFFTTRGQAPCMFPLLPHQGTCVKDYHNYNFSLLIIVHRKKKTFPPPPPSQLMT